MKTIITTILLTISIAHAFSIQSSINKTNYIQDVIEETPSWDKDTIQRIKTFGPLIIEIANKIQIDPKLLLSIAWAESHFNPEAKSFVGALGIMQVKPLTQKYIFKKSKIKFSYIQLINKYNKIDHKIIDNILAGGLYIKYLLKKYDFDIQKAVVAYNIGPTGTYRLLKKDVNLDNHNYYVKISNNLIAMN